MSGEVDGLKGLVNRQGAVYRYFAWRLERQSAQRLTR